VTTAERAATPAKAASAVLSPPAPGPAIEAVQGAVRDATVPRGEAVARGEDLTKFIVAGLVGFGAVFAVVKIDRKGRIDLAATRALQRWHGPQVDRAMELVSWPGFPPQSRVIPAGIIGGWLVAGLRTEAAFQAAAWGSALLATVVKTVARRPRPIASQVNVVLAPLGGTSFPSGHVLSYVGTYGFLAYLLDSRVKDARQRRLLVATPLALVAVVGPSRIYQGHHWLTDVLASYLLGLSYVAALATLYRRWLSRSTGR
jgi:undecaprenyl-diphosphatase